MLKQRIPWNNPTPLLVSIRQMRIMSDSFTVESETLASFHLRAFEFSRQSIGRDMVAGQSDSPAKYHEAAMLPE